MRLLIFLYIYIYIYIFSDNVVLSQWILVLILLVISLFRVSFLFLRGCLSSESINPSHPRRKLYWKINLSPLKLNGLKKTINNFLKNIKEIYNFYFFNVWLSRSFYTIFILYFESFLNRSNFYFIKYN
jgi:hypothetical protein